MKKIYLVIIILFILISVSNTNNNQKEDDLIRVRIIANSNSEYDQKVKTKVSNNLKIKLYNLLKDEKTTESARKKINENMSLIDNTIKESLKDVDYLYSLNYGYNYFPQKEYNGKIYEEGQYESLLITLGNGEGNNWWCILFPPICLIEAEESEKVEYTSFFKTLFDKIIRK